LKQYIPPEAELTWAVAIMAAAWLSGERQVSRSLWAEACRALGHERAAIALVSAKSENDFTKSAAAYFGGKSRKAQRDGHINLAGSVWALRQRVRGGSKGLH